MKTFFPRGRCLESFLIDQGYFCYASSFFGMTNNLNHSRVFFRIELLKMST